MLGVWMITRVIFSFAGKVNLDAQRQFKGNHICWRYISTQGIR